MIQFIVMIMLYFIMFFAISFIINMLIRKTWFMSIVYPIIILLIVGKEGITTYFTNPAYAFKAAFSRLMIITPVDIIILSSGFIGTILAGVTVKILRKRGYQMF